MVYKHNIKVIDHGLKAPLCIPDSSFGLAHDQFIVWSYFQVGRELFEKKEVEFQKLLITIDNYLRFEHITSLWSVVQN